jgi:hypothetical protein
MCKIDIAHYFADVILPDEIEIFANEVGRQAIENLVDGRVEWDNFAIQAPGWQGPTHRKYQEYRDALVSSICVPGRDRG